MTRPFPNDPQWLQLSRKLPPDAVIERLLRFGFRAGDIADRFDCNDQAVTAARRRIGLPPIVPSHHRNGATLPYRVRMRQGCLTREGDKLVMRYF